MGQLARPQIKYKITVPRYSGGKEWFRYAVSEKQATSFIALFIGKERGLSTSWAYKNYKFIVKEVIKKQVKAVESAQLSLFN